MRFCRPVLLVAAAVVVVLGSGCDALVDRPGLAVDFGSPYSVLFGQSATAVNGIVRPTPFTDESGMLHVAVEFTGGCADHVFGAAHRLAATSATIWLVHANGGDLCEARQSEEVVVALPAGVLEKASLFLTSPSGREEAITRFDNPAGVP